MKRFLFSPLVLLIVAVLMVGGAVVGYQTYLSTVSPLGTATVVVSGDFEVTWPEANGHPDEVAFGNIVRGTTSDPINFSIASESPETLAIWAYGEGADAWCQFEWDGSPVTPSTELVVVGLLEPQGGASETVNLALDVLPEATADGKNFTLHFGSTEQSVSGTITSYDINVMQITAPETVNFSNLKSGDTFTEVYTLFCNSGTGRNYELDTVLMDGGTTVLTVTGAVSGAIPANQTKDVSLTFTVADDIPSGTYNVIIECHTLA